MRIKGYMTLYEDSVEFSVDKLLEAYGIPVMDSEGNHRGTYDVLNDLAEVWNMELDIEGGDIYQE